MPFTKRIWRAAERVIANSSGLQQLASATGNRWGVTIDMVPNGVDVDFFSPPPSVPPLPFRFLFAGRFSPQKNLGHLLDQFEKGPGRNNARLALVGDGPEMPALAKKIRLSSVLTNSVELHPWRSKEELLRLYRSAHCFVNPSFCEGMPNTLLEAMACGLPAVASDIGGNNELVFQGKNGYLFRIADKNQLANCMEKMMTESDIDTMGAFSRHLVCRRFSWEQSARAILNASAPTQPSIE